MTRNYKLVWESKNTVFPTKLKKSIDNNFGFGGSLICNECESKVKQKYICQKCGNEHTIGQIKKRKDKETGLVYNNKKKKEFLKSKVKSKIKIKKEVNLNNIFPQHIENLNTKYIYELYSNDDDYSGYIKKLKEYMSLKNVGFLAKMGYRDREIAVLLIPTRNKVLITRLRDSRLIRTTQQKGIEIENTDFEQELKEFTKNSKADLITEFLDKVAKGETIEVKQEEEKEEIKEPTFLDSEIENLKERKVKAKV